MILQKLIKQSAIRQASIEFDFTVNFSEFSTSKFNAYYVAKHETKRIHEWVKVHINSGLITNIVIDVIVTGG